MSVVLGTICLNEFEWLPKLYEQHRDWPGLLRWVFVEGTDPAYRDAAPDMVSAHGLSVDGTTEFLEELAGRDPRIIHVRAGLGPRGELSNGKRFLRQAYLDWVNRLEPEIVVALDADEFYEKADQPRVLDTVRSYPGYLAFILPRRDIWWPPYMQEHEYPILSHEAVGGFWGIPCCHWWRWVPGMNHRDCHNAPSDAEGIPLNAKLARLYEEPVGHPEMVHLGFAARRNVRLAKNHYYERRGESADRQRAWYVESRAAWDRWQPGDKLPREAQVIPYTGPIPEVFR